VDSSDAGGCVFSYSGVVLTEPQDAGPYGGARSAVSLSASLVVGTGLQGTNPPNAIDVEYSAGATRAGVWRLIRNGDVFLATVDAGAPMMSGSYTLKAFYDAGLPNLVASSPLPLLIDNSGPQIAIRSIDGGATFKRDEVVMYVVSADEPLSQASLTFDGLAQAMTACPMATCMPSTSCRCFNVDMSDPPLPGMDGGFLMGAIAQDLLSNLTSTLDGGAANVTRMRWQRVVTTTDQLRAALALGADGTVYVGSDQTATTGTLFALSPAGVTKPGWPDGGVGLGSIQSVAVASTDAGEVVFYAANSASGGAIGGRLAGDGGQGPLRGECLGSGATSRTYSGLGLARFNGTSEVVAAGAAGIGTDALPVAYRTNALCLSWAGSEVLNMSAPEVPAETRSATNVAIDGTTAYFIGRGARTFSSTLTTAWSAPTSLARPASALSTSVLTGSALHQTFSAGGWQLAASGWNNLGNMHLVPLSGAAVTSISTANNPVGMPAVLYRAAAGEIGYVFAGVDGVTPSITRFQVNPGLVTGPSTSALASTSPVLGAGTNRLGYVVDGSGQLTVFPTQSFSTTPSWRAQIPGGSVFSSPTLDCVRNSAGAGIAGARVGVLYVASTNGTLGTVTALIVDSPKLDDAQYAWPKYQRTAGNAGNVDTTFEPNPGCP
jgi:hypothetical protein